MPFFGFADGRRLMADEKSGLRRLFVFGRNQSVGFVDPPAGWTNRGSIIKAIASIAVANSRDRAGSPTTKG
jgi:hypothetical protein